MLSQLRPDHSPAALLLDLDGTLIDSAPDLAAAIDAMLVELQLAPVGEKRVRMWVGNGAAKLVRRALSHAMACAEEMLASDLLERAQAVFFGHYQRMCCGATQLYNGVAQALAEFQQRGLALACVTNKPGQFTHQLLQHFSLGGSFGAVVSGDTLTVRKPDPAPLQLAARELGVSLGDCVMVGDSRIDMEAARNAGISAVAVSYGYTRGVDASQLGADLVVDDLRQLLG